MSAISGYKRLCNEETQSIFYKDREDQKTYTKCKNFLNKIYQCSLKVCNGIASDKDIKFMRKHRFFLTSYEVNYLDAKHPEQRLITIFAKLEKVVPFSVDSEEYNEFKIKRNFVDDITNQTDININSNDDPDYLTMMIKLHNATLAYHSDVASDKFKDSIKIIILIFCANIMTRSNIRN